eukprot:TRINITY_DN1031_c1_g1_i2.p1 TRINITY_DN1031_c1_g1~~TRINITY_DN1031_c1_g1_i2.p1  ORF type:complete len:693 (-),score=222.76 TRINITY_DN1031_c1_g1_i2:445-2445(-)
MVRLLNLAALLAVAYVPSASAVTPLQRVTMMLQGMKEKGLEEKQAEQVQFASYKTWCDGETTSKTRDITEGEEQVEFLTAAVNEAEAAAKKLGLRITELDESLEKWAKEKQNATATRDEEKAVYTDLHKEYTESINAITKAREVLKKNEQSKKSKGDALALLASAKMIPKATAQKMTAFLAGYSTATRSAAPEEEVSGGTVIDMLDKLKEKFVDERSQVEKEEVTAVHNFALFSTDIENSIKQATESKAAKEQEKSKELQVAATKKAELEDASATKTDDEKYLNEVKVVCAQKASDFEQRQKIRADELSAIDKAMSLLSEKSVGTTQGRVSLVSKGSALAHLRSGTSELPERQEQVAQFLQNMADKFNSNVLSVAAERAAGDPTGKVGKMIEGLIERLEAEQVQEKGHQGWCEAELATNKKARTTHTNDVDTFTAEIDAATSKVAKLGADITALNEALAESAKALAEEEQSRTAEKAENEVTIKDAKDAQEAITSAITTLKEFYSKAAKKSLVQLHEHGDKIKARQPEIFEGSYNGQEGASGGVISMLEVLYTDFSRLETTTKADEAAAAQAHDEMEGETKLLRAQQGKDVEHKTREKAATEQGKVVSQNELTAAQNELQAAKTYFEKLKDSCFATGSTAQEREARRQEEIQSLKDALHMLEEQGK